MLRKYYDLLLSSFPQDPGVAEQRLHINSSLAPPNCQDSQLSNQLILDHYITMLALSSEQCSPSLFCKMMSVIIGNTDITAKLENGMGFELLYFLCCLLYSYVCSKKKLLLQWSRNLY